MSKPSISTLHGVKWISFSQAGNVILQLVSIFTLARILPPSDYGLMAIATVFTAFAALFSDMGTGAALIQKDSLSPGLTNAVFWFNVVLGLLLTFTVIGIAPIAALSFSEPRLLQILLVMSPVFIVSSLGIVHKNLFERKSEFRKIAIIELMSSMLGLAIALIFAWRNAGVYSLVAQSLSRALLSTLLLWIINNWRPVFSVQFSTIKEIWKFSGNIFLFNIVNYSHRNMDSILIGRFLGTAELGFYNIAYRVLLFRLQNITFVISRATFPAYSRHQNDKELIASHYLSMLETIAFITAPVMALIWALREPFILLFLGNQWLPSADVLAWLAPVGFFQSLVSTSGSVLNSIGRANVLRNLGFIGTPFLVLSFVMGLPWGIQGVAASYCLANFIWVYPVLKTVLRLLSRSFTDFLSVIFKPILLAVATALLIRLIDPSILPLVGRNIIMLLGGTIIGFLIYILLAWIFLREVLNKLLALRVTK